MKILILDVYKKANYRISKDTNGGYGTANNFSHNIFSSILSFFLKKMSHWPPLFAAYTFSILKKNGHDVKYTNQLPEDYNSFDLFIITSSIVCFNVEIKLVKFLKEKNKKIFVIGPFATNMSDSYVEAGANVIMGEPEFYFLSNANIVNDLGRNKIFFNHSFSLDDLPIPRWDLMFDKFTGVDKLFGNYKSIPIIATRGCPYSCGRYCVYPLQQGNKIRQRNINNIIQEIEFWKKDHNVEMFIFRDPVFSINRKHTVEFCENLLKKKLNIKFAIETHLKLLDDDLVKLLAKSGLVACIVGIESSEKYVLNTESRFTVSQDDQLKRIKELEKEKIKVSSMFILGYPSDNSQTIKNTINYAKYLNTTYAQFNVWTPYPGTPVYNEYKEKITETSFESFDQHTLVYKHENFKKKDLKVILGDAYVNYYFRFKWFLKFFKTYIFA